LKKAISSMVDYIRQIERIRPSPDEVLLYRGHADRKRYKLLPSVLRNKKLPDAEHAIVRELVASHPGEFAFDATTLEQLVRVQHYSLPTRLLDVTWNPLVALFFATQNPLQAEAEVIVFRIKKDRVKFFDSDTVSCLANLAHLRTTQKKAIDFSLTGKAFNDQLQVDRLLQFIRMEKPHFKPRVVPDHLQTVLCVKPKQSNKRILAQSGAFLLFGLVSDLDTRPIPGIEIVRIRVDPRTKIRITKELDRMGINESTMFPEIEKAALYIKSKL
jgi:hypothetical protein